MEIPHHRGFREDKFHDSVHISLVKGEGWWWWGLLLSPTRMLKEVDEVMTVTQALRILFLPSWSWGYQAWVREKHGDIASVTTVAHAWVHCVYKALC